MSESGSCGHQHSEEFVSMLGSFKLPLDMLLNFAPNGRIFFLSANLVAMVLIEHKSDSNGLGRTFTAT